MGYYCSHYKIVDKNHELNDVIVNGGVGASETRQNLTLIEQRDKSVSSTISYFPETVLDIINNYLSLTGCSKL